MSRMLFLDLLNSSSRYYSAREVDPLFDPDWRTSWAKYRELPLDLLQSDEVSSPLAELRSQLRDLLDKVLAGQPLNSQDEQMLNSRLELSPQVRVFSCHERGYELQTQPLALDANWLLAEIVASFGELLANHELGRVKACANPDCQWMFYDESHARTRRWCDDACGNRMKVRRFRQRQRS